MKSAGIFGGSFNPVHNGHLYLADTALEKLSLDKIYFVPSNIPPHKSDSEYAPAHHRLNMLRLATEYSPYFEVSDFEIRREGISYTINTVEYFRSILSDYKLFLMTGSDMLMIFDKWREFERILEKTTLAVVSRNPDDAEILHKKADSLSEYGEIIIIDVPPYPVSSTEIRKNIRNNQDFSCNLPQKVVQYIQLNKLYNTDNQL